MPLNESTEAELLAYAYGELSGPEARAFEQRLQADAELRAELESLRATRELLGADARWGLDTKVDAPPPHLFDAIVRAEALARPAEIRNARALTARPTLTARLSRWLVGGGVLVGATAAILVVVGRSSDQEMLPASPLGGSAAPAPAATAAMETPVEADGKAADRLEAKEEAPGKPAETAALMADAPASPMPDDSVLQPREDEARPRPNEAQLVPKGGALGDLEKADHGGAGLGVAAARGAAATGADDDEGDLAKDLGATSEPKKPQGQASAMGGRFAAEESAPAGDELRFDGERSRSAAPSSMPPPPAPPAPEPAAPASVASPRRSQATSSAPTTTPDQAPALQERPSSSSLDVRTRDELKADRKRLADLRREQNEARQKTVTKSESLSPPADKAPAPKPAPAKSTEAAGGEKAKKRAEKKPPLVQAGPEAKRAMDAEIAYVSGLRELKEGRPLEALDEFQAAERLDARRGLGVDPQVGQMRALLALKRAGDALVIARRLAGRDVAEPGVVDGLLLGAKTAEQLGDLRSARELWTALLKAPAQKGAAQAALARIGNPAVRSADMDAAEAAAEAPAAAAPAAKD